MNHSTSPISKSRPMKLLLSNHLVTSTPDSHQISKRIKGISSCSEHYKGDRKKRIDTGFPLQGKNYRKSRELRLEFWNTVKKSTYLGKFLKSLKNVQKIRIRFCEEEFPYYEKGSPQTKALERLCQVLCKISWLQRIHIDFPRKPRNEVFSVKKSLRCLRFLAKLKDLMITIKGEEAYPFSASLLKVGFSLQTPNPHESVMVIKDVGVIQKLMKRVPKFEKLDTIRGNVKWYAPERLFEGLAFVISKLPNLRELDFNSSACHDISLNRISKILEALAEAQKLEILKVGLQMKDIFQINLLRNLVFKKTSLRRTHLSLFLFNQISLTPTDFQQMFDLLQEIPSLYELHLDFFAYIDIGDEILDGYMERISGLTSIRELKIVFNYNESNFGAKQAGNIIRWIFNKMVFLEELDLVFPKNCLEFFAEDIQEEIKGLSRLKKARIQAKECDVEKEKSVWGLIEILGRCERLRELELDFTKSVHDSKGTTRRLCESLGKLKELQVFSLHTNELLVSNGEESSVDLLLDLVRTFDKMRNLQDFHLDIKLWPHRGGGTENFWEISQQMKKSTKYRFFYLGYQ